MGSQVEFFLYIHDIFRLVHLPEVHAPLLGWLAGKFDLLELPRCTLLNVLPSSFHHLVPHTNRSTGIRRELFGTSGIMLESMLEYK